MTPAELPGRFGLERGVRVNAEGPLPQFAGWPPPPTDEEMLRWFLEQRPKEHDFLYQPPREIFRWRKRPLRAWKFLTQRSYQTWSRDDAAAGTRHATIALLEDGTVRYGEPFGDVSPNFPGHDSAPLTKESWKKDTGPSTQVLSGFGMAVMGDKLHLAPLPPDPPVKAPLREIAPMLRSLAVGTRSGLPARESGQTFRTTAET